MRALFLAGLGLAAIASANELKHGYVRTSDGVRLHYYEAGKGPAILFVPGWTCPAWVWEPQVRRLSRRYRVLAMDPRSQGESDQATEGHYPERRAQDVKELIEQLRLAPAVVVGHSMAVTELLAYVDQFGTSGLAGLVLVDEPVFEDPTPAATAEFLGVVRALAADRRAVLDGLAHEFFKTPQPADYFQRLVDGSLKTPTSTALALLVTTWGRDFRPVLAKLDKPLLYAITPELKQQGEVVKAKVPQAQVEVFENSGHALFVDEAERFNGLMEDFARRALPPAPP